MVGVDLIEHVWCSGRLKDHRITFTYHGDREMAKGIIADYIADEHKGTNCRFYASQSHKSECYVLFDEGRLERYAEGETHAAQS